MRRFRFDDFNNAMLYLYDKVAVVNSNGTVSYTYTLITSFNGSVQPAKQPDRELNLESRQDIVQIFNVYTQELKDVDVKNGQVIKFRNYYWEITKIDEYIENIIGDHKCIAMKKYSEVLL
jgi:hypothetical protein